MITEDYISFDTAKLMKEKGFNERTNMPHIDDYQRLVCYIPTLQMTMKWLREVHKLHVDVDPSEGDWNPTIITLEDWTCAEKFGDNIPIQDSYEEVCEEGIKYCLENLI